MNKIFIDCGANDCHQQYDVDYIEGFRITAFEPNPKFKNSFRHRPDITFHPKAVWVENGEMDFYIEESTMGCSLLSSKMTMDPGMTPEEKDTSLNNPIKVTTVDLAEYITSNHNKEDLIIVRMDIEGAEFAVLKHLIDTECIDYIDELWVEFHVGKVSIDDEIIQNLKDYFNNEGTKLKDENGK